VIDGTGENITDFLLTQQITSRFAIVEIKTTTSPPLDARPFRDKLSGPHELLYAVMTQALAPRAQLVMISATRRTDRAVADTNVRHVHCLVIAGRAPTNVDRQNYSECLEGRSGRPFDEIPGMDWVRPNAYMLPTRSSRSTRLT
jgi:hypothetical protein